MMLAMTTTDKFSNVPVRHRLGVMSGGHSDIRPSFCMCPSYLLVALLVSGEFHMADGDAASSVGCPVGVRSPLLHEGAVLVVVAPPWTPR